MDKNIAELYNWYVVDEWSQYSTEFYRLCGNVKGHDVLPDYTNVVTTRIINIDEENDYLLIETENTIYKCRYAECIQCIDAECGYFADETKEKIKEAIKEKDLMYIDAVKACGAKEKDIVMFVSAFQRYYVERCYYIQENNEIHEMQTYVHVGMFQDSVLVYDDNVEESNCRFYPYKGGRMSFYDFLDEGECMIVYNTGDRDIQIDVDGIMYLIRPGRFDKITPENKEIQIEEPIAPEIDKFNAWQVVIKDGKMTGYKVPDED